MLVETKKLAEETLASVLSALREETTRKETLSAARVEALSEAITSLSVLVKP